MLTFFSTLAGGFFTRPNQLPVMINKNNNNSGSSLRGVSRKTQARNVRSVLNPKRETDVSDSEAIKSYTDLLHNELEPERAFLMPRPVPTPAGVIFQHAELSKKIDVNTNAYNALIARPSVYNTLQTFETVDGEVNGGFSINVSTLEGFIFNDSVTFWLAPDIVINNSENIVPTVSSVQNPTADFSLTRDPKFGYSPQEREYESGLYSWSGNWTRASPAITVKTTQNIPGNIQMVLTPYYLVGGSWVQATASASTTLNPNNLTDIPVAFLGETGATQTACLCEITGPSTEVLKSLNQCTISTKNPIRS